MLYWTALFSSWLKLQQPPGRTLAFSHQKCPPQQPFFPKKLHKSSDHFFLLEGRYWELLCLGSPIGQSDDCSYRSCWLMSLSVWLCVHSVLLTCLKQLFINTLINCSGILCSHNDNRRKAGISADHRHCRWDRETKLDWKGRQTAFPSSTAQLAKRTW